MKTNLLIAITIAAVLLLLLSIIVLPQILPKQPVENDDTHLYYKDSFGVYIYQSPGGSFFPSLGPDLRLFRYRRISKADPKTFQILQSGDSTAMVLSRDQNNVFYGGEYVPNGDVSSLKIFDGYAKDRNNVYFRGLIITGLDTESFENLGNRFVKDRNGLYLPKSSEPRKIDLVDAETFNLKVEMRYENNRLFVAEDKNFLYYDYGGDFGVEPKSGVTNFQKLGCRYYLFEGKVFYSLFHLAEADPATFRVLGVPEKSAGQIEECHQFYAIDKNYRWQFGNHVRFYDYRRNHQIDVLLAEPEDKRKMSKYVHRFVCIPEPINSRINSGYMSGDKNSSQPGTIRTTQYMDAEIMDAEMLNAEGNWQTLPSITGRMGVNYCNEILVNTFSKFDEKPWFERRNQLAVSFTINWHGNNSLHIVADASYAVKLAFLHESLSRTLKNELEKSRVEYSGVSYALKNNFFLNKENLPEIWIPLQIKGVPVAHIEGKDFVVVGFVYRNNSWQCIDAAQCSTFDIPNSFELQG